MGSCIFDDLLLQGIRSGKMPAREASSRDWFRDKAKGIKNLSTDSFIHESGRDRMKSPQSFQVGSMYLFGYDPKHKKTLPYYDMFPLIFPIGVAKSGFYGINFHYLPHQLRAKLMDSLYETANNDTYDINTKLRISYETLNSATKFRMFKPTLKHYLFNHVRTRLIYIHPTEWDIAIFLPLQSFQGASASSVWKDSKASLRR
jgi:hypothetical protein